MQTTCANLLRFHVEDILGLAQIKAGKFRKNIQKFNIKKAIEEVVEVQESSANEKGVSIEVKLDNFPNKLDSAVSQPLRRTSTLRQ